MPIEDEIKAALLGDEGPLNDICRYVLAYERGRWEEMAELGERLALDEDGLPETALAALTRARDTLSEIRPGADNAAAAG